MKTRKGFLVKRGKTYYACWYVAGKLYRTSTHQTDKEEAQKRLNEMIRPFLVEDEVTTLSHIAARISGAKAELANIEDKKNPPTSLAQAWTEYLSSPNRPDSGDRTLGQNQSELKRLLTWMNEKHPDIKLMQQVTQKIAEEYANNLSAGKTASTFNHHLQFLRRLWRVLSKKVKAECNPWLEINNKTAIMQNRRELTIEELRRVCDAAKGEHRLLLAIGLYCGLRLGDCATLRWGEIDLVRGIIRRIPMKTSRRRSNPVLIPIHPTLRGMLSAISATRRRDYVLPDIAVQYLRDNSAVSKIIQAHFQKCEITTCRPGTGIVTQKKDKDGNIIPGSGKRAVVEVGFHSLRHSFVSLCRTANAPLAVVESIVGHNSVAMTQHYTHVGEKAALMAVSELPDVIGNTTPAIPSPKRLNHNFLRESLRTMNADNWSQTRDRLLAMLSAKNS